MAALPALGRFDRSLFIRLADWLAIAVAVALPWSTTASAICIAAWLLVALPSLDTASVKRELQTPAGGLPVLLFCLGVVGMMWADVGWSERFQGLNSFHRLLVIPLLLAQFRRSDHGIWVLFAFLISSACLLLISFMLMLTPGLTWRGRMYGVPVHDDIFQGSIFLICAYSLLGAAFDESAKRHRAMALAFIATATLFLANFAFAFVSRIALVVGPVLAGLLGWRQRRWKGVLAASVLIGVISLGAWLASPNFHTRLDDSIEEFHRYRATNERNPIAEHAAYLRESMSIIASAPMIGHGTGSIHQEFRRVTAGKTGAAGLVADNPHNQTFAVAIQLGLLGGVALWSMWLAHLMLFRGKNIMVWIGLVVVVENVVSSTVHSHLFDFNNGWLYAFGVGVLGGTSLREREELLSRTP
jgi:O-antigen ligase